MKKTVIILFVSVLSLLLLTACTQKETLGEKTDNDTQVVSLSETEINGLFKDYFNHLKAQYPENIQSLKKGYKLDLDHNGTTEVLYQIEDHLPSLAIFDENQVKEIPISSELFVSNICQAVYIDEEKGVIIVRSDGTDRSNFNHHVAETFKFDGNALVSVDQLNGLFDTSLDTNTDEGYKRAYQESLDAFNEMFDSFVKGYELKNYNDVSSTLTF